MVAPLIVGTARVVKAGSKTTAKNSRAESIRNTAIEERRSRRNQTPLSPEERAAQNTRTRQLLPTARKLLKIPGNANGEVLTKRIKASAAASLIFWGAISFFIPQIMFWLLGIGFIGTKLTPLIGEWIPGEVIFIIFWFLIVCIGIGTMLYASAVFLLRGIDCFSGMKGLMFVLSTVGYFVFFINLAPWFVLWVVSVVYLQNEENPA